MGRTRLRTVVFGFVAMVGIAVIASPTFADVPDPPACTAAPFTDIPIDHPFCAQIAWMADQEISTGWPDNTYRPSLAVTRAAMSAFMARLADVEDTLPECTTPPFTDIPIDHPFCEQIAWMADQEISTGWPDNTYRPSLAVTRAAMSAFMYRLDYVTGCTAPGFITEAECQALVALYKTTLGDSWHTNTGWLTGTNPCDWHGVTCSGPNVAEIDLTDNALTGSLPPAIGELANLQSLNLSGNLIESLPAEIGQLASLQSLDLSGNRLTTLPDEIGELPSLGALLLGGNDIPSLPGNLWTLSNLLTLELQSNDLSTLPSDIDQLTSLQHLHLDNNHLGGVPGELGQLNDLQDLTLSGNSLTNLPPEIGQLTSLENLWLGNNSLTALPNQLGDLSNLATLNLVNNELTGDISGWTAGLFSTNTLTFLNIADGVDGNDCLTTGGDPDLANWLSSLDPGWNECFDPPGGDCPAPGFIPYEECLALVALYNSTNGDSWNTADGWLTNADPCTWFNVGCDGPTVTSIFLFGNNLSGSLPQEIGDLANLESMTLSSNNITALPDEIGSLTALELLRLSDNDLTTLPAGVGGLTSLHSLYLDGNDLSGLPVEIGDLANLAIVDLSDNALTALPAEFGSLTTLQTAWLHLNDLTTLPGSIGNLTDLGLLNLAANSLTAVPTELGNLVNLVTLSVAGNSLTGDLSAWMKPISIADAMQTLQISDGPGFNDCLTTGGDIDLETWLSGHDPIWNECD